MIKFLDLRMCNKAHSESLLSAMEKVLKSGWYVLGQEVSSFEREFSEFVGVKNCVGVSNGLDGLTLMLEAAGVGEGDEVIVPSNTYIATWLAISHLKAVPVPVEPDPSTYNLSLGGIKNAVTKKTKAVLVVHLYGKLCEKMEEIASFCKDKNVLLFEDSAQCHGTIQGGKRSGSFGDASAFSFYPGKNLGALGDAGCVVTNSGELAENIKIIRNYGSEEKYHNKVMGRNCRLDELQAAFLRVKLKHIDSENTHRKILAKRYLERLLNVPEIELPVLGDDEDHTWHLFVVKTERRQELMTYLKENEVQTLIHYPIPPHLSEAYRSLGYKRRSFPIAEKLADTVMSLPIGPHLQLYHIDKVCDLIGSFFSLKE